MATSSIIALLNGDYTTAGKEVVVEENTTLSGLFTQVSDKVSEKKENGEPVTLNIVRVFASDGSEISKIEDVKSGNTYFFSCGEDFIAADSDEAFGDSKAERKQIVQNMALTVAAKTKSLYSSYQSFVLSKSPAFIKGTIQSVGDKVGAGTEIVWGYGQPYLLWADDQIEIATQRLRTQGQTFLKSDFGQSVNKQLMEPFIQKVLKPSEVFFAASVESFKKLDPSGEGNVSMQVFTDALKTKLGESWNEKLAAPAEKFYTTVQKEYKQVTTKGKDQLASIFIAVKQKLGAAWDQAVVAAGFQSQLAYESLKNRVQQPAEAFYRSALESYQSLYDSGDGKVSLQEFYVGMRVKLGSVWNEGLLAPAKNLYETFTQNKTQFSKDTTEEQKTAATEETVAASAETTTEECVSASTESATESVAVTSE